MTRLSIKPMIDSDTRPASELVVRFVLLTALLGLCALAGAQRLEAQVTGELRGRVSEVNTGRPIANARVELVGSGLVIRSASDGTYTVRGLEPREYRVSVRAVGYVSLVTEAIVQNALISRVDIELEPAAFMLERMLVEASSDTVAANAVTFGREAIEASGKRDLGGLLQAVPGVVVTKAGGPGQPARVSIRGSSSNQVLIVLDGIPLNSALDGSADLTSIALETIERVRVLTGAQSARYGPRAMAGVIDIVTRHSSNEQTLLARFGDLGERSISALIGRSIQKNLSTFSASMGADHQSVLGNFSYSVPAVRGGGRAKRLNADVTLNQANASFGLDNGSMQVRLRSSLSTTDRGMAGSIIQPSLSGRQHYMRFAGGVSVEKKAGNWTVTSAADATHEGSNYNDPTPPFGQRFADTVAATGVTLTSALSRSWRPASTSQSAFKPTSLSTSFGADVRHLGLESNRLAANAPDGQILAGIWTNTRVEHSFNESTVPLRLSSDFALRVDHSSLLSGETVSPRVMLRLEHRRFLVSSSYGSGFAPPTIADQFFHEGVQVRANPNLKPERSKHDVDVRFSINETEIGPLTWNVEAAAYRSDITGMILWFPDFRFIWSPHNYDVTRRGWEARGALRIPSLHLEFQGFTDHAEVRYTGNVLSGQVVYRPQVTASLQSSLTCGSSRLDVTTRYVGTRRTAPGTNLNALPPYQMTDIRFSSAFNSLRRGWTFSPMFAIENLFNRDVAMLVDYPFPTRMWSVSLRVRRSKSTQPTQLISH